jgi:glycosyltransferase involved in cell wall biosynthesis
LHQHRTAYDLWDHPLGDLIYFTNGQMVRDSIREADRSHLGRARSIYANSGNVAARLKRYCDLDSKPLYHPPPGADLFYTKKGEDFLFFPSRLCPSKRQSLLIEALGMTKEPVRVRFAGAADEPGFEKRLKSQARKIGVERRVEFLGEITEEEKREYYATCLAVIYPPIDEDYGYVTLEAMLAAKPVITCSDSGGPLEFVVDNVTGCITEPTPDALAAALDQMWRDRTSAAKWGETARVRYDELGLSWANVVRTLLS